MQDDTLVVLAEYNTITEAEIAKSMLDSAGIWSTIRNEYMSAIYPIGTMPAQIVVREEDYEKAKAMLHHPPDKPPPMKKLRCTAELFVQLLW